MAERGLFVTGDPWSPECGQGASPTCVLMERQLDPSDPPTARGLQGVPGSVSRPPRPTLAHIPAALLQWGPTPLPAPFPRPLHGDSGTLGHHGAHEAPHEPLGWAPSSTLARSLMRASPLAWGQQPAPREIRRVAGTPHVLGDPLLSLPRPVRPAGLPRGSVLTHPQDLPRDLGLGGQCDAPVTQRGRAPCVQHGFSMSRGWGLGGSPRPQPAELGICESINGPGVRCARIGHCVISHTWHLARGGKREDAEDRVAVTAGRQGQGGAVRGATAAGQAEPKGWW